jgi:hypothetical protein
LGFILIGPYCYAENYFGSYNFLVYFCHSFFMTFKFSENAYEYLVRGSVAGANSCVEIYASPLFTDEQLQIFCIAKHEEDISIFRADLSGRGSANTRSEINSNFSGTLTSQTADYIITWVAVSFVAYDEDGEITEHLATAHTWAVPFEELNDYRLTPVGSLFECNSRY